MKFKLHFCVSYAGVVMTERMNSIKAKDENRWRTVMGVGEGCVTTKYV